MHKYILVRIITRAAFCLLFISSIHAEDPDIVTLTDQKGRSITVKILGTTNQNVSVKNEVSGKQFLIPRDKLTPDSMDKVTDWEKTQPIVPHKHLIWIKSRGNREEDEREEVYQVSFMLPKGPFVISSHISPQYGSSSRSGVTRGFKVRFDNPEIRTLNAPGWVEFSFDFVEKDSHKISPLEYEKYMQDLDKKNREQMTPKTLAEHNKRTPLVPISSGDFSGFYLPRRSNTSSTYGSGGEQGFFLTNGKISIEGQIAQWDEEQSPMNMKILVKVIGTIVLEKSKFPGR
jgi:hypothetical protein